MRSGQFALVLGVIAVVVGLIFNAVTSGDGNGANIGAGLVVIAGAAVALVGFVLLLVAFFVRRASRSNR